MPNSDNIEPLSMSQKKFLQLLLASHVMTDSQCQKLYKEISSEATDDSQEGDSDDDDHDMGTNMEDCIGTINKSLEPAFGLEIRTIAMTIVNNNGGQRNKTIRYHAVCNRISGSSLDTWVGCHKSPHEIAYLRVLLENIAEKEVLENQHSSSQSQRKPRGVGCTGKLSKIDCMNLRADLEAAHRSKFNLHDAERALLEFEREGWLVVATTDDDEDDDDSDDDDDDDGDDDNAEERRRKRTKSTSTTTSSNNKNKSSGRKMYQIGPRSYCELSNFLKEILLGGRDALPQFIHHG